MKSATYDVLVAGGGNAALCAAITAAEAGAQVLLSLSRTNPFFLGGGKALVNVYYRTAEQLGVEILYETEVVHLQTGSGRFDTAKLVSRGFPAAVEAKSLVVAAGGFQADLGWLDDAWGPAARNFIIRGTPYNRGRLLHNLIDQDVQPVGDPTQCHAVALDARAPQYDGGIATRLVCVPFSIVVNKNAQRFYDEGEDFWPKRYAIWGRLVAGQPDQIGYFIIDRKSLELFMPSIFPAIGSESVRGLAEALDLDPAALEKTVVEFNAACQTGTFDATTLDDCCTRGLEIDKTHWARPISEPPFYGYPLRTGVTFTYLGLTVDETAKVQMNGDVPSENIFAAGEVMAGNILGKGYLAGIGMTIGTVFGRIAGREAARGNLRTTRLAATDGAALPTQWASCGAHHSVGTGDGDVGRNCPHRSRCSLRHSPWGRCVLCGDSARCDGLSVRRRFSLCRFCHKHGCAQLLA